MSTWIGFRCNISQWKNGVIELKQQNRIQEAIREPSKAESGLQIFWDALEYYATYCAACVMKVKNN